MDAKIKELIAIAAAVTAGNGACLEDHVAAAQREGADRQAILNAIAIAKTVRLQVTRKIDGLAPQIDMTRAYPKTPETTEGALTPRPFDASLPSATVDYQR